MDFTNAELIVLIESPIYWEYDYCEEACKRAGLADEFAQADNNWEMVTEKAIQILTGDYNYKIA